MRLFKEVGAARVSRLTFLLVFFIAIIVLLARSCFIDSKSQISNDENTPTTIRSIRTTETGKLNVTKERYYSDLALMPPNQLPEIYKTSDSTSSVYTTAQEVSVVDSYFDENDGINPFENLEININLPKSQIIASDTIVNEEEIIQPEIETIKEQISQPIIETTEEDVLEPIEEVQPQVSQPDLPIESEIETPIIIDENPNLDNEVVSDEVISQPIEEPIDTWDTGFSGDIWDGGFVSDFNDPMEPILFAPYIQTQEEYDSFIPIADTAQDQYTDDFFSDFYIAGETNTNLYDDGIYYLALYVNDENVGDVATKFEGDVNSISVSSLYENTSNLLSDYAIDRLFNTDKEYYTVDELNQLNVITDIDPVAFEVHMQFDVDDMPVQYIPIKDTARNTMLSRSERYGISDTEVLTPNFFSAVSALNLTSSYTYGSLVTNPILRNNLNMSNSFSLGNVALDFSNNFQYLVDSTSSSFDYTISSWRGFFDIRDKDLRITFGNVGTYLGTNGIPVGFTLEKNYSYGDDEPLGNQFTKKYIIDADSVLYVYVNNEEPIVKNLKKGEYVLQNFPLQQGANRIRIKIEPIDKNYPIILDEFDVAYDTSLMGVGDYIYGLSAAISKTERESTSTNWFTLPYIDGKFYDYDISDFDTRFYINLGLTTNFTLNSSFAFSTDQIATSFQGILATLAGSFKARVDLSYSTSYSPDISSSVSHIFDTPIGPINTTLSLQLPVWENDTKDLYTSSGLDLSLSHTLNFENYPSLSTSFYATFDNTGFDWQTSFSSTYTPLAGLSFSGGLNIGNNTTSSALDITFQIGVGLSLLNNMSVSQSLSSSGVSSLAVNYKPTTNDIVQFNIGAIQYLTQATPVFNMSWQHIDDYFTLLLRQNISNNLSVMDTSASISSALFYTGGLFGINRTASNNFIIVKPENDLAHNTVSIGKTTNSALDLLNPIFGNVVYTVLSANAKNNLIIYGTKDSLYSSGTSFSFTANTGNRTAFSKRLIAEKTYTVSGVLLNSDGTAMDQYSSPMYQILTDENGNDYLQNEEALYLFTDVDGRFILSEVKPGRYLFDMDASNNQWYGLYFNVEDNPNTDNTVILLEDYTLPEQTNDLLNAFDVISDEGSTTVSTFGDSFASDYIDLVELPINKYEDEQVFWDTIFPPIDETQFDDFAFTDTASDWQSTLVDTTENVDQNTFESDPAFSDTAENWQDSIDNNFIPTVVQDNVNTNPNYTYVP